MVCGLLGNYQIGHLAPDVPGGLIPHLWSLAVEEQFYLLWPFVVFFSRRLWPWALAAIICAPVVREAILQSTGNPFMTILTLPSCMDLLAAGALVAVTKDRRVLLAMAAAGGVIAAWCLLKVPYSDFGLTPLWVPKAHILYTGLALLFGPLMVLAPKINALGWSPLVWIGRVSYGLYIWHLLAFALSRRVPLPEWAQDMLGVVLACLIAAVSWYVFEKPILRLKDMIDWPSPERSPTIGTEKFSGPFRLAVVFKKLKNCLLRRAADAD